MCAETASGQRPTADEEAADADAEEDSPAARSEDCNAEAITFEGCTLLQLHRSLEQEVSRLRLEIRRSKSDVREPTRST